MAAMAKNRTWDKMQFLAYNSKTKALRAKLAWVKLFIRSRSICPENFRRIDSQFLTIFIKFVNFY
jgi:hypothetical protein